ncbi:MAG: 23S rRNA (uracil(1939)-C(5))-methyltransferase RlmD [Xanthomonadaceae bacterium]|nr:23S rRNA (uracil(1939)-C(5))-methyltransferase RlmD [Xanthomonadaceae bacterium]
MTSRKRQPGSQRLAEADIAALSPEGRGVAHVDGQTVFVWGALPGERVLFRPLRRRRGIVEAEVVEVLQPSPDRIEPACRHFGVCGGCSLQHVSPQRQRRLKSDMLRTQFERIGKVEPEEWLPPLHGEAWGYRRKARLGVKLVAKKGGVLVGFRERSSSLIAPLERCEVLDPRVGHILPQLAELVEGLSVPRQLPQIEVAIGDNAVGLVFRHLAPLTHGDHEKLATFGRQHGFQIYLQPGDESTVHLLWPEQGELTYRLPDFDVELAFRPTDFTQVNAEINRLMVSRAVELLDPQPQEAVLDLFCGLGNFTLPLARRAARAVGVEGEPGLVERAHANARRNGLDNCEFHVADLSRDISGLPWMQRRYDKLLLDPARSGAAEAVPHIARLGAGRIVYVSCNPATLARDAGMLVHDHGYRLRAAGIIDMFPNTAHVESIAVFEQG